MHNMNWKFLVPASIVNLILVMVLLKVFPSDAAAAQANGGILVDPNVQAGILFAANIVVLLVSLAIAARRARTERLAEEQMLASRRAENMAAAQI
jgi:uncharacterized membrane protein YhaH (DUF805 family)